MPTIPLIQDSAELQTGTGRQSIQTDASAFGAREAQALAGVGQALGNVARVAEEKDDEFNVANARDLDTQLERAIQDRLRNPDTGYLTTQRGLNARDASAAVQAEIDGMAAEIAGRARTPRAAALYQDVARRRVTQAFGDIADHEARETRSYQNDVSEAAISAAVDGAVAGYADPTNVARHVGLALSEVQSIARREGWDDRVTADRARRVRSDIASRVLVQLATTDPEAAERYYLEVRPQLSAQDAAETLTSMRAAQRQALERVEGAAWQAFANGQPLQSMGDEAYREFTTNPLYGQAHARVRDAYRVRAQSYADGTRVRDNSPAYIAGILAADRAARGEDDMFTRPGQLEAFLAQNADAISGGDMVRLLDRRRTIMEGGSGTDTDTQVEVWGELRTIARASFGEAISPPSGSGNDRQRERADAFDATLQRETQRWLAENNGRRPQGEEIQIVIGRAIVGMDDAAVRNLPEFRVEGDRGRTRRSAVTPSSEANVPYAQIPPATARRIGSALQARLGRTPTQGEVENAYSAFLQDRSLDQVLRNGG